MRVLIDACVLYPTVLRQIVMGVAETGAFVPLWSARILEEWARAARARADEEIARGEIAVLRARHPEAEVAVPDGAGDALWLPDANDVHVLAAAIAGRADVLMTLNLRDFPGRVLSDYGILPRHPDPVLLEAWEADPGGVARVVAEVHAEACRLSGEALEMRWLLKRARLPRLGKALAQGRER